MMARNYANRELHTYVEGGQVEALLVLQPHFASFRSQDGAISLQSVLFRSSNHHQSIGDGRGGDRFGTGAAVVLGRPYDRKSIM